MATLRALDLPLGPALVDALTRAWGDGIAVAVLDPRVSPRQRERDLTLLGATEVEDLSGVHTRRGAGVESDTALTMLTSGSSGVPKAAELSREALLASAAMTSAALRRGNTPLWYPCLPASHIGGLAVLLRAVLTGTPLVWGLPEDVSRGPLSGATHTAVVRAQLHRYDLSGYDVVLLGGARPPGELPPNVVTTWGMTETGSGIVYDGIPLEGVDVVAHEGELLVRSPTLFSRYRGGTRPVVRGPDGRDDWFPTGDGGEVVDGRVHVRGRLGTVISTGGEKVWPEDLEALASSIEGLREIAVTGVADDEWGQRVVALVVTDGRNIDDELRGLAAELLGPWAKPKEIRYVAALPRTANGKIRRADLEHLH